ncbi:reverse transcriptase domain-containing protein [Microvirga brassicacearum]|uniref:Reverse transcriptase domain-containing protein n=1 Tax=Microvirga brassicacearum TaxID=2580413 RepID=A0A5N3P3R3_9HYPH|nr:reverse transcriptase domain-containing protein [Microvirga brassicacearum]KAB0264359.1 hypothetical protein FEZ63_23985 [Microvirga brassicacearum]
MTVSAFQQLCSPTLVRRAWTSFWQDNKKQTSSGVDGLTPAEFHRDLEKNLHNVCKLLREGYRFSPLRGHPIPKPGGKTRIICIPTVQDRIVQRLLAEHLTSRGSELGIINDVSFGFIKGRGLVAARDRAASLRQLNPWAYKSDISAFFDRIPRADLVRQTVRTLRKPSFRAILTAAASCEIDLSDAAVSRIVRSNGIVQGLGVRQGMPLSPVFANIILRDFDKAMMAHGVPLVRYADDFIAFAKSERECQEIDEIARELLGRLDFELPALADAGSKTFIAAPEIDIEFLGLALTRRQDSGYNLVITKDQFDRISSALGNMISIDSLLKESLDITNLGRKIDDKVGGYNAAYRCAHNGGQLAQILAGFRSSALRNVYVKAFGETAVRNLTNKYRRFLGLETKPRMTTRAGLRTPSQAVSRGRGKDAER